MIKTKLNYDRSYLIKTILNELSFGYGVEVGTFKGEFSKQILNNWNGTLYMVDVWRGLDESYEDSSNHKYFNNDTYSDTIQNIIGFEDRAIMIRSTSELASHIFANDSLDFVYIDANHAYDFVKNDIEYWYPKIKKGGYLLGHDYIDMNWQEDPNFAPNGKDKYIWDESYYHGVFGVNPAVDEFCEKMGYDLTLTLEWFGTWMIKKI
jgi:hypothetical protein